METPIRAGRWLVSGALGLAVLSAGGCAAASDPGAKQAGPAVMVNAGAGPANPPATKAPAGKDGGAITRNRTDAGSTSQTTRLESDGQARKVPAAKPRPAGESPASPLSPRTAASPRTPVSANTP